MIIETIDNWHIARREVHADETNSLLNLPTEYGHTNNRFMSFYNNNVTASMPMACPRNMWLVLVVTFSQRNSLGIFSNNNYVGTFGNRIANEFMFIFNKKSAIELLGFFYDPNQFNQLKRIGL